MVKTHEAYFVLISLIKLSNSSILHLKIHGNYMKSLQKMSKYLAKARTSVSYGECIAQAI